MFFFERIYMILFVSNYVCPFPQIMIQGRLREDLDKRADLGDDDYDCPKVHAIILRLFPRCQSTNFGTVLQFPSFQKFEFITTHGLPKCCSFCVGEKLGLTKQLDVVKNSFPSYYLCYFFSPTQCFAPFQ